MFPANKQAKRKKETNRCLDGWMDGWMDGWTDGWMRKMNEMGVKKKKTT